MGPVISLIIISLNYKLLLHACKQKQKYIATLNLCRLSKGKMIGVNYNQTATWVGGSLAYFEK